MTVRPHCLVLMHQFLYLPKRIKMSSTLPTHCPAEHSTWKQTLAFRRFQRECGIKPPRLNDILGRYGIGNINSNSLELLELFSEFSLCIINSTFHLAEKHKITRMHNKALALDWLYHHTLFEIIPGEIFNSNLRRLKSVTKTPYQHIFEMKNTDDTALVSHSYAGLQRLLDHMSDACNHTALVINTYKTEILQ